jgi:hypothetical protein
VNIRELPAHLPTNNVMLLIEGDQLVAHCLRHVVWAGSLAMLPNLIRSEGLTNT